MKYLKKFNESREFNESDYYYKVSYEVASDHMLNMVNFNKEIFFKIADIIGDDYNTRMSSWGLMDVDSETAEITYYDYVISSSTGMAESNNYRIFALTDDWYLVYSYTILSNMDNDTYYMCDQIEGLEEFIKRKFIFDPHDPNTVLPGPREHNESLSENNVSDYYKLINSDEFDAHMIPYLDKIASLSDDSLSRISATLGKKYDVKLKNYIYRDDDGYMTFYKYAYIWLKNSPDRMICIYELEDSWFLVRIFESKKNLDYICDQIDGLELFIKGVLN